MASDRFRPESGIPIPQDKSIEGVCVEEFSSISHLGRVIFGEEQLEDGKGKYISHPPNRFSSACRGYSLEITAPSSWEMSLKVRLTDFFGRAFAYGQKKDAIC